MPKVITITIPLPKIRGIPAPPAQQHRPKKGKGSYHRHPKHKTALAE